MPLSLLEKITRLINQAKPDRQRVSHVKILRLYWLIGQLLSRQPLGNKEARVLSEKLKKSHGNRFHFQNLKNMLAFFLAFPDWKAIQPELSWAHYWRLSKVTREDARRFYLREAATHHWSARELARQIDTLFFERQVELKIPDNNPYDEQAEEARTLAQSLIKEHYILEFLGIGKGQRVAERELESALLDKLQQFLMELGDGFAFVARQKRIVTLTGKQFYIDLVFYHFRLRCFVLIDLKIGELTHGDVGQMDMYVRLYEDKWRGAEDNPTMGIILCTAKDQTLVKYSVLQESQQLFASTYQLYLPTEEELSEKVGAWWEETALEDFPNQ